MASRSLKVEIIGDSKSLEKALGSATNSSSKFGSVMAKAGKAAVLGFGAAAVAIGYGAKKAIEGASDLTEQINKTNVVFGENGKQVQKWSTGLAESFGLSSEAALESAGTFGNMLVPMGFMPKEASKMSEKMVELAGDMASFNNASPEDTLKAIQSGLAGQVRPLRQYGVFLSAATVQQEAMAETGKKNAKELTTAEKTLASYNIIMKQTTLTQGDFARSAGDSMANQIRIGRAELANITDEIGLKLLPVALQFTKFINDQWPTIAKVAATMADLIGQAVTRAAQFVSTNWNKIKVITETVFNGALSTVRKFSAFISSDLGQKLTAGAVGLAAVAVAASKIAPAVKGANAALTLMKANPVFVALIPLGIAIGAVAQDFLKAKLAAAELAQQWDVAAGSARGLKDAVDGLKDANLGVKEAQLAHEESLNNLNKALATYNTAVRDSGKNSAAAKDAGLALRDANLQVERTALSSAEATKRQADAHKGLNEEFNKSKAQIFVLVDEYAKMNGTFAQTGNAENFAKKMNAVSVQAGAVALKLKDVSPAAAAAQGKAALLASVAADLATKLGRVPSRTEIIAAAKAVNFPAFYRTLLDAQQKMKDTAASARTAGSDTGSGFNTGLSGWIGTIAATAANIGQAAIASMRQSVGAHSDATEFIKIGHDVIGGLLTGLTDGQKDVKAKLTAIMGDPATLAALGQASNLVGRTAVNEMIRGIVGMSPSLQAQARTQANEMVKAWKDAAVQRVKDAQSGLASAFGDAASAALAAFDAISAKQTAAQKQLAKMQAEDAKKAVDDQVKAARDALAEARAAASVTTVIAGESPEDAAARQAALVKAVKDAQVQLTAALRAQKEAELAVTIQSEQDKRAAKRQAFVDDLNDLETWAQNHSKKHKELLERIKKLWKDYIGQAQNWGRNFGEKLAQGLRDAIPEVEKAAQELADALKNRTKGKSPTKEGPLSTFDPKDAGFDYAASFAQGLSKGVRLINGSLGAMDIGITGNVSRSSSQPVIHTHVYLDRREIALAVSQANPRLTRAGFALA